MYLSKTTDGKTFIIQYKEGEWMDKGCHESWDESMFLDRDYTQFLHDKLGELLNDKPIKRFSIDKFLSKFRKKSK